jgi:hypothetical protein
MHQTIACSGYLVLLRPSSGSSSTQSRREFCSCCICSGPASCGIFALLQIVSLSEAQIKQGLVTCSTGNHALAFVYACGAIKAARGAPTTIYLPCTASSAKVTADEAQALACIHTYITIYAHHEVLTCFFVSTLC